MLCKQENNDTLQSKKHSMAAILAFYMSGLNESLEEELVFGCGMGLDFKYIRNNPSTPSRVFSITQKLNVGNILNDSLSHTWSSSDKFPWDEIKAALCKGKPVLLGVNPSYLPYNKVSSNLDEEYAIIALEYKETYGVIKVIDLAYEVEKEVLIADLADAMYYNSPDRRNHWLVVDNKGIEINERNIRSSLYKVAHYMLSEKNIHSGVSGIRVFAQDLSRWKEEAKDWKWSAIYCHRVLNSTGDGTAYRSLFADYLAKLSSIIPELETIGAIDKAKRIAELWEEVTCNFYAITKSGDNSLLHQTSAMLKKISIEEERLYSMLLSSLKGGTNTDEKQLVNES